MQRQMHIHLLGKGRVKVTLQVLKKSTTQNSDNFVRKMM